MTEGGPPCEIDPNTLATIGEFNFNNTLQSTFSAHPKIDPNTNEIINQGQKFGEKPILYVMKVDSNMNLVQSPIKLPWDGIQIIHDMGITNKYIVIYLSPYGSKNKFSMLLMLL